MTAKLINLLDYHPGNLVPPEHQREALTIVYALDRERVARELYESWKAKAEWKGYEIRNLRATCAELRETVRKLSERVRKLKSAKKIKNRKGRKSQRKRRRI